MALKLLVVLPMFDEERASTNDTSVKGLLAPGSQMLTHLSAAKTVVRERTTV